MVVNRMEKTLKKTCLRGECSVLEYQHEAFMRPNMLVRRQADAARTDVEQERIEIPAVDEDHQENQYTFIYYIRRISPNRTTLTRYFTGQGWKDFLRDRNLHLNSRVQFTWAPAPHYLLYVKVLEPEQVQPEPPTPQVDIPASKTPSSNKRKRNRESMEDVAAYALLSLKTPSHHWGATTISPQKTRTDVQSHSEFYLPTELASKYLLSTSTIHQLIKIMTNSEFFGACCFPSCGKKALVAAAAMQNQRTHPVGRRLDDVRMNLQVLKYYVTVCFMESSLLDIFASDDLVSPTSTARRTRCGGRVLLMELSDTANTGPKIEDHSNQNLCEQIFHFVGPETESIKMRLSEKITDDAIQDEAEPSREISHPTTISEGYNCSSGFFSPDDVIVTIITAFLSYCRNNGMQILHENQKVLLGICYAADAPSSVCLVLDACHNHARRLFLESGSTSDWSVAVTRKNGYCNLPYHTTPYTCCKIFLFLLHEGGTLIVCAKSAGCLRSKISIMYMQSRHGARSEFLKLFIWLEILYIQEVLIGTIN